MSNEEHRLIQGEAIDDSEQVIEQSIRPHSFDQYIGQAKIKRELSIYIQAAKGRSESLDHVLLHGPPGLGKTTLALVIANEMGVEIKTTSGPAIEKSGDLLAVLNELEAGDIIFIDEIHRLSRSIEEMLYSAMEDFYIDIIVGEGSSAHPIRFPLPPFTLIGATTRGGKLSAPLRDRFGIVMHMDYYKTEELADIIKRTSDVLNAEITDEGAYQIALRSRGTPRVANRLLKRVRDVAEVKADGNINDQTASTALGMLDVDENGLDATDKLMLKMMIEKYNGGPVGLTTIAANIGEEVETIEDMIEPYLLQSGMLQRTPRGRIVTKAGYINMGYPYTEENI